MHLSDRQLELIRRSEMAEPEARSARAHIVGCEDCAQRLRALSREEAKMENLLRLLDHEPPRIGVDAVIRRARARPRRAPSLLAAGIAILFVVAGAAAMPGSPVRQWLARLRSEGHTSVPQQPAPEPEGRNSTFAPGISLTPDGAFDLVFEAPQADGSIRITLSPGAELAVRPIGGAVGYSVRPEGVWVQNAGSRTSYEVVLPRDAPRVRIRVADVEIFAKDGATIRTVAPQGAGSRSLVVRFEALGRRP